ncbi:MAG: hypothetical protein AAGG68_00035 [Bacteroidota bacterium]
MKNLGILALFFCISSLAYGQKNKEDTTSFHQYYELNLSAKDNLHSAATNGLTAYKGLQNALLYGLEPALPEKLGGAVSGIVGFGITYYAMLYSHEFGHVIRTKNAGGKFKFHNHNLPFPYTTLTLPEDVSLIDEAISVTGGFEVNYLAARRIQNDFMEYNGAYNTELGLYFAHRMMLPIYTTLVTPVDPKDPNTWIETAGDPVHIVHPIWEMYNDGKVFESDGTVTEGLVNFYNQLNILGTFWNLTDPTFLKSLTSLFKSPKEGQRPWYIIGDQENGWTYGTSFNTSPLGYELYLHQYVKHNSKLYQLTVKTGEPFKNNSINLYSPNFFQNDKFKIGAELEVFDQAFFGTGFHASGELTVALGKQIKARLQTGYKTEGYVLGRQLDSGLTGQLGLIYVHSMRNR